ncbi:MAG TPA: class I tRNA ligase family protein, partial [Candidatus Methylomirabilis sp.]|nr:class I tRNA ligase family protein [Candidatus Methylomirabilis sp.]
LQHVGLIIGEDGRKMSKRWGNVINPDDIIEKYGADAMRVYEMFMGPFGAAVAWSTNGLVGARKFLDRIWTLSHSAQRTAQSDKALASLLHKTIKKVGEDIADFKFNTCVSALMILSNAIEEKTHPASRGSDSRKPTPSGQEPSTPPGEGNRHPSQEGISINDFAKFMQILSPFAPHLAEEIWREKLGNKESIFKSEWPKYDPELIKDEMINLVVQINGKLRATIAVSADISEDDAKKIAQENENVKKWLEGKEIIKTIFVPGKLLNLVIK